MLMLSPISFLVNVNNIENTCELVGGNGKFPKIITVDEVVL